MIKANSRQRKQVMAEPHAFYVQQLRQVLFEKFEEWNQKHSPISHDTRAKSLEPKNHTRNTNLSPKDKGSDITKVERDVQGISPARAIKKPSVEAES